MTTAPTLDEAGRELAPSAALFANAVAVIGGATGLLLYVLSLAGVEFNAWPAAGPLTVSLLGALMLGVAPGLWLIGRQLLWEHSRTLVLPTVVVVVGLFAVTLLHLGDLSFHGGALIEALLSLGWVVVLGALAVFGLTSLAAALREPALPLPVEQRLPGWTRPALAILGSAWFGIGVGLVVLPDYWGGFVPWTTNQIDAQMLGVGALALGVGVLGALTEDDLARVSSAIVGLGGVAVLAAVALVVHAADVDWTSGPALSLVALVAGLLVTVAVGRMLRPSRATPEA